MNCITAVSIVCGCGVGATAQHAVPQVARSKGALATLASTPDVIGVLMDTSAFVANRGEGGSGFVEKDALRLADPTLRLLLRFAWDEAGLEVLRRWAYTGSSPCLCQQCSVFACAAVVCASI